VYINRGLPARPQRRWRQTQSADENQQKTEDQQKQIESSRKRHVDRKKKTGTRRKIENGGLHAKKKTRARRNAETPHREEEDDGT